MASKLTPEEAKERRRERSRRWWAENPEKALNARRSWNAANRKRVREASREWKAANREKAREAVKKAAAGWRRANPDRLLASAAKRRALQAQATTGDLQAVAAIYRKAKAVGRVRCAYCGKYPKVGQRHVDHVIPLSRGGSHSADNLVIACGSCNLAKHAMTAAEYAALLAERRCA